MTSTNTTHRHQYVILDGSPEDLAARARIEARAVQASAARSIGVRLFAEIKASSKYFGQTARGEKFPVCIQGDGHGYVVSGGPGGQYRLADINLFAESIDGRLIELTK